MRLDFDCTLHILPGTFVLDWHIVNHEPHDVGLFNRIRSVLPDGTDRFSPDIAWVEMDPTGALLVQQCALAVPAGLSMAAYVPPFCSRVAAGGTHRDTVRLPVPVPEMQIFKRALLLGPTPGQAIADVPRQASRLTFAVGAFAVSGDVRLSADQPAFPDVLSATPNAVARQEVFRRSFDLAPPLPVLGYRVAPWP